MAANPQFRFFYIVWAFLECLLFGGLLFGWGSLVFILIEEGVYSDICPDKPKNTSVKGDTNEISSLTSVEKVSDDGNSSDGIELPNPMCTERDNRLTLVFAIASVMFCVGCAAMGHINFKFGTRITRFCALICFTAGSLMTGFTSHELPWIIFPGLSLLGIGGTPLLMTNIQFSMLFDKGSSTVVSFLSGSFDASSGVMLIVKILYERGVFLHWSMLAITLGHFLTLISTFLFLPRGFIIKPAPKLITEDAVENETGVELMLKKNPMIEESKEDDKAALNEFKEESKQKKLPSIKFYVRSPRYILHVVWLSILQLRFYYFLGSLNTWLNSLFASKAEVSFYTNVCMYAMMCGLITSPVAGLIYDLNKRIFASSRTNTCRDLMPAVIPLAITSLLGITLSALVLVNTPDILYVAFVFNTVFRSFIYSIGAAYIGVLFPSEYFGILYGLMIIISGVFSLVQYGLFSMAEVTGLMTVNVVFIALMTTSLVHPLYQWYTCWRAENQVVIEG